MVNIEEHVITWLSERGYSASLRLTADSPPECVTCVITGGGTTNYIYAPTVAIDCWAETEYRAAEMAADIVTGIAAGELTSRTKGIYSARHVSTTPSFDPDTHRKCREVLVDIYMAA